MQPEAEQPQTSKKELLDGWHIVGDALAALGVEGKTPMFSEDANERASQYKDIARASAYEKYC